MRKGIFGFAFLVVIAGCKIDRLASDGGLNTSARMVLGKVVDKGGYAAPTINPAAKTSRTKTATSSDTLFRRARSLF